MFDEEETYILGHKRWRDVHGEDVGQQNGGFFRGRRTSWGKHGTHKVDWSIRSHFDSNGHLAQVVSVTVKFTSSTALVYVLLPFLVLSQARKVSLSADHSTGVIS